MQGWPCDDTKSQSFDFSFPHTLGFAIKKDFTRVFENNSTIECKTLFSSYICCFGLIVSLNTHESSQICLHGFEKRVICSRIFKVRCKNHFVKLHLLNFVGTPVNQVVNIKAVCSQLTSRFLSFLFLVVGS